MHFKKAFPKNWTQYELIDSGEGEKLERFGEVVTIRPEPFARWNKKLSAQKWKELAMATFKANSKTKGEWILHQNLPETWSIDYSNNGLSLSFHLKFTQFKHVGIFPEQADNWDFIYQNIKNLKTEQPSVLNMFAYTGGASLAAKAAGADVIHLDSVKQVISWSRENQSKSDLKDIRWMLEDAMKFIQKSSKNGKKFHGIILDPPAFGLGANGKNWKLERDLEEMMRCVLSCLDEEEHFFVLNTYSHGWKPNVVLELLNKLNYPYKLEIGSMGIKATSGQFLNLGIYARGLKKSSE